MSSLLGTLALLACLASNPSVFKNGELWNDTQGHRIEAHGGGILKLGDMYYLVGEDRRNNGNTIAVNLYSSKDLVHWTFENDVINAHSHPLLANGSRWIERPKQLYNETTGQFVIWVHWEGHQYMVAEAAVFSCETINGDYTFHKSMRPLGNMARDCNVFKDDDGRAYFMAAANHNKDMIIYELSRDCLDIKKQVVTLWPSRWREAPVMFKRGGTYYLLTSGATGWEPNQGKYATATSVQGPWSGLYNFADRLTFDTQPTTVIQVEGSEQTTILYWGDRWKDPTNSEAKYIVLPLEFHGSTLQMDYYETWKIDMTTGRYSGQPATPILPYMKLNSDPWQEVASLEPSTGDRIVFGPQAQSAGSWGWTGPNGFSSTSRSFTIDSYQASMAGEYIAAFVNAKGGISHKVFTLKTCKPPTLTPYLQINSGSWQKKSSVTLKEGDTLWFGPHPTWGGTWSWTGPNGFTSDRRDPTIEGFQPDQAGQYIATFTKSTGCRNSMAFTIKKSARTRGRQ